MTTPESTEVGVEAAWQHLWDAHGGTNCSECMPLVETAIRRDEREHMAAPADASEEALRRELMGWVTEDPPSAVIDFSVALDALLAHREARLREALGGTP